MYKLLTSTFCLLFILNASAQFSIKIETNGKETGPFLIQNLETLKIDTVEFKNGKLSIPNNTKDVTPFAFAQRSPQRFLLFFAEPKKNMVLSVNSQDFTINTVIGSKSTQEYLNLQKKQGIFAGNSQTLQQQYAQTTDARTKDSIGQVLNFVNTQMNSLFMDFITANKSSNMTAYILFDVANRNQQIDPAQINEMYDKLDEKGKSTFFGKALKKQMAKLTSMEIGQEAPSFSLKDRNGKSFQLKDLRGKYVLLDFWASWCGPCVQEIPNLKAAYDLYKNKGFEIMSVSIDRKNADWLRALDKHALPWINVIDEEDPEKKITQQLYHVPTIPRTILLDKKGIVVGKDFRGKALELKLAELMK
jgi:peroxiredoxin